VNDYFPRKNEIRSTSTLPRDIFFESHREQRDIIINHGLIINKYFAPLPRLKFHPLSFAIGFIANGCLLL